MRIDEDKTVRGTPVEAVPTLSRTMGRTRMQIHRWMKRWEIDKESFRK